MRFVYVVLSLLFVYGAVDGKTLFFKARENVVCPDKQGNCPDGTTCCQLESGKYGCCPYPDAVCCSDHAHCCPNGYTCDVPHQQCLSSNGDAISWSAKTNAVQINTPKPNVICPDQQSQCGDGQTCCQLTSGQWGCCPYPQAACCSDHEHCCPNGYTCNVAQQKCMKSNGEAISWSQNSKAIQLGIPKSNGICPDQKTQCGDGQTCCQLVSGQWGCCPYPQAICCSDHAHCCPNGYTCDVPHQQCLKSNGDAISWSPKTNAIQIDTPTPNVICPDQQSQCGDGQTCCQLTTGQWGCCPYPQAVCCSDHAHCCPNGRKCDVPHQQCLTSNGEAISWSPKTNAIQIDIPRLNGICPDQKTQCGDGQTCCQLVSSQWGCCPYPQAVCCSDHAHCCPNGYTCDVPDQKCLTSNGDAISWSLKTNAVQINSPMSNVICPDQQSQCGEGETCCQLTSGQWGCCPYPQAVCCSDHDHCCPDGYTCDVPDQKCSKSNGESISWSPKTKALTIKSLISGTIVCPGGQSLCQDSQTCCQLGTGIWACCPLPKAVCCDDHEHCCPNGYTCNVPQQECTRADGESLSWSGKLDATPIPKINNENLKQIPESVTCPDQSTCGDGETCCLITPSGYGCCPLPQATCCSDLVHCCPHAYNCDLQKATCVRADGHEIPWSKKSPAKSDSAEANLCQSRCREGSTCCSNSTKLGRGCCPYENAICCSDGLHCCPENSVCDTESQMCQSNAIDMAVSWKLLEKMSSAAFSSAKKTETCPDLKSECPDETTCCQMQNGLYGCCPFNHGLCCADKLHCCPNGFKCDLEHSTCVVGESEVTLPWEMFGRRRAKAIL